jgi:4-aminobutyrate aminotransferase-like enzyme
VIRITPPMNVTRTDVDEFIGRLDASLSTLVMPAAATSAR